MINNILVLQHIGCEPLGVFEEVLRKKNISFRYLKLYKDNYKSVDIGRCGGLIILGGPMNVDETDKYPFLSWEIDLIRKAQDNNLSILGICLGAQLIAKANGAKVIKAAAREVGWHKVWLTPKGESDRIFSRFPKGFNAFQLHSDMFEMPKSCMHLIESFECKNQAFRIKDNVYCLQFHLELTQGMLSQWLKVYEKDLNPQDLDNILMPLGDNLMALTSLAESFLKKFTII